MDPARDSALRASWGCLWSQLSVIPSYSSYRYFLSIESGMKHETSHLSSDHLTLEVSFGEYIVAQQRYVHAAAKYADAGALDVHYHQSGSHEWRYMYCCSDYLIARLFTKNDNKGPGLVLPPVQILARQFHPIFNTNLNVNEVYFDS